MELVTPPEPGQPGKPEDDALLLEMGSVGVGPGCWSKLEVPVSVGVEYLGMGRIALLKASGSYTEICCVNGDILMASGNLSKFQRLLPGNLFFRCHRSYLINLVMVERLGRSEGYQAFLQGGWHADVSRRRWTRLRHALQGKVG